jgi:hypothetical protein
MARLRLYARLTPDVLARLALRWFNVLPEAHARQVLIEAGVPNTVAGGLVVTRPLTDVGELPPSLRLTSSAAPPA